MINVKELQDTGKPGYRINEGKLGVTLTYDLLKKQLEKINEDTYGLPISITEDQVKSGGVFNSSVDECLVITNNEHPTDYFKYCITMRRQGKIATVIMNVFGTSKLTYKQSRAEERKKSGSISGMIMNAFLGPNETDVKNEYDYYDMIENLFDDLLS